MAMAMAMANCVSTSACEATRRLCSLPGDGLFGPIFTSDDILAATDDAAWVRAMLDAESALALAEADGGVLPITFGFKAAQWLVGVDTALDGIAAAAAGLQAQLGGAVGTLAALGPQGVDIARRFAAHLGLAEPLLPWHTARQRVAQLAATL